MSRRLAETSERLAETNVVVENVKNELAQMKKMVKDKVGAEGSKSNGNNSRCSKTTSTNLLSSWFPRQLAERDWNQEPSWAPRTRIRKFHHGLRWQGKLTLVWWPLRAIENVFPFVSRPLCQLDFAIAYSWCPFPMLLSKVWLLKSQGLMPWPHSLLVNIKIKIQFKHTHTHTDTHKRWQI